MTIVSGHPNQIKMHSYKFVVVVVTPFVLNAMASTHFVA